VTTLSIKCHYTDCHYAECCVLFIVMLSDVMLMELGGSNDPRCKLGSLMYKAKSTMMNDTSNTIYSSYVM